MLRAAFRTEAAGDLGLDLNHAQIALRLIVVKRNGKVFCKQAYGCLVIPQAVDQRQELAAFRLSAFPRLVHRLRVFFVKKAFPSILSINQINIGSGKVDLERSRQSVVQYLLNTSLWKNQKVSTPTYYVKEALRKRFISDGCEYIQRDEFNAIANDAGVLPEEIDILLEDLRDLGICLWYDDDDMQEYSTLVLNPSWISHGIYRLINWGLNEKKQVLCHSDFAQIFTGKDIERYPEDKADFLFCLMRKYQLAFFKDKNRIFIPLLLPADRPSDDLLPSFEFGERLHMEYQADRSLPEYTVSRLSVIHSDELVEEKSWRFGAVLRWNETDAIVVEHDLSRSVSVSVKGPMQKAYITRLRDTLNSIFNEYKCNRPELKIELLIPDELRRRHNQGDVRHRAANI